MTTAARPTFEPAKGGRGKNEGDLGAMSKQYSSRDLPSHTKLKYRQEGQGSLDEQKDRDFRRELDEREHSNREKKDRERNRESGSSSTNFQSKRPRLEQMPASNLDADDPADDDDDNDDDSDEDDTAALMAELQKIKKERAAERTIQEIERKAEEERIRTETILKGNPLINQDSKSDFTVKRRWDDDVVFKNCAKDAGTKKGFINDTLRSEFHRKFMEKYVKM